MEEEGVFRLRGVLSLFSRAGSGIRARFPVTFQYKHLFYDCFYLLYASGEKFYFTWRIVRYEQEHRNMKEEEIFIITLEKKRKKVKTIK